MAESKTRWKYVFIGLGLVVTVGFLLFLGAKTFGIYTVSQTEATQQNFQLQAQTSALQAFAAIAGVVVALVLAVITYWYAHLTKGILEKAGPIVSVELLLAWYGDDFAWNGFLAVPFDIDAPSPTESYSKREILVKVVNSGNGSVMVDGIGLRHSSHTWYTAVIPSLGVIPPHRLDGNSSANFFIELDGLLKGLRLLKDKTPGTIHVEAVLGNGQTVQSAKVRIR